MSNYQAFQLDDLQAEKSADAAGPSSEVRAASAEMANPSRLGASRVMTPASSW